ncbi:hypothetical protein EV580_1364 [Mycobacterium sp. BK086]|uniref:hypothetical protein n=1 Tax=Mycobacterium sp. BK086 TaxID=2512165 RepID=UPI00105F1DBE|nr:hypothetical protein [Mycobacterium sp. BK086]TDO18180.1 hypothetical protein EV580_1364 [Mycobacterium sp. BK086]
MRADDALKYAAARLHSCTDWAIDSIGGSDACHGHEDECGAIADIVAEINGLAAEFGDRGTYSDGRKVKTGAWIDNSIRTEHVWHPDPAQEKPLSWRGNLLSDPGSPCPGVYEVTTDPATQDIHVRVVRTV